MCCTSTVHVHCTEWTEPTFSARVTGVDMENSSSMLILIKDSQHSKEYKKVATGLRTTVHLIPPSHLHSPEFNQASAVSVV
jgi:hypothetical protein